MQGDEFVGPFSSWKNVRAAYGAAGDGVADDTAALQRGLSALVGDGRAPVLYLPRGTYRITATLSLDAALNVSVVGEDPATTTIVWDGPAAGTMFSVNGVAYSRVTRLTFDGRRRASVAVEQSWDSKRGTFDTGNEYADDRFVDTAYGIHGGFKGAGFAETSIVRAAFIRNTQAGVALGNFNALDLWVWDSRFEDCGAGLTNGAGAGNFHVYDSVFHQSSVADLVMGNTGEFSARGNYSAGSHAFFVSVVSKAYPASIHLQRNTIVDPIAPVPIDLKNQGPGLLTDNVIRSTPGARGPVIEWQAADGADVTSVGNTFTVPNPIRVNGRLVTIDDRIVETNAIRPQEPVLPGTPRNLSRPAVDVAPGASASDIQQAIDQAVRQNGQRPVVHIPFGSYAISRTLTIPASDLQLVGDGFGTVLRWTGVGRGPVVDLKGPTKATLREIEIDGASAADGLIVENADQIGARAYLEQVQLRSGKASNLFVHDLDHAVVEARDFGFAYSPDGAGVVVTGGPLAAAGRAAEGRTNVFSGASSGNRVSFDVSGGAKVLVRDLWYESGNGPGFASIHDEARFTIDGARIATPPNDTPPAFAITGLNGTAAIVGTHLDDRIVMSGNGANARVLGLGIADEEVSVNYFLDVASPRGLALLVNARHREALGAGNHSLPTPDSGPADASFITALLAQTREEVPRAPADLPAGVTDFRAFRVWVTAGLTNLTLTR